MPKHSLLLQYAAQARDELTQHERDLARLAQEMSDIVVMSHRMIAESRELMATVDDILKRPPL